MNKQRGRVSKAIRGAPRKGPFCISDRTREPRQSRAATRTLPEDPKAETKARKTTKVELRDARIRYRLLFEHSPDGIVILDPATIRPLEFNDTACRQLGYSRKEFARLKLSDIEAAESPAQIRRHIKNSMREGRHDFETLHRTRQGELRNVQVTARFTESAGKPVYHCIWRDITARKRAEEALRRAHERLRGFVDANIVGVVIADASGRVLEANDYYLRMIGYSRQEFEQGLVDWRAITPPEWLPVDERAIQELRERGVCAPYEKEYVRRDGTRISVFISDALLPGPEEHIAAFVLDITERKRAELALRESEARYRLLIDNAQFPAVVISVKDARVLFINERAAAMFGVPASDAEGLSALDFWCRKKDLVRYVRLVKEQGVVKDFETELRAKSGARLTVMLSSNLIEFAGQKADFTVFQDITERKRAEEAVRESEKKFRALYDFLPIPVYEMDLEANITAANRAIFEAFRGTEDDFKKGFNAWKLLSPEDAEKSARNVQRLLKGERISGTEYNFKRLDGSVFPAIVISSVIYHHDRPTGLRGAIIDITERRKAEEELRRMNAFLGSIVENIPNMIFIKDAAELRFVRFNRAGEDLLGYSREDLLGKNDYDIFPKEQADFFTGKDREILRGKELADIPEESIRTRRRGERVLHTRKVPILKANGEPEYLLGISEDITERKRAERLLIESEKRFRDLVERLPQIVFETDIKGNLTYANQLGFKSFGYSLEDFQSGISVFELVAPEERESMKRRLSEILGGAETAPREFQVIRKDGGTFPALLHANTILENGVPIGVRGIAFDITERKRAEEAIRASLREKDTLLREIHHRVKNNMQVISSLFNLQAGYIKDEAALQTLKEGQNRIRSMALIHEKLYQSPDLSTIDFASYLRSVAHHLFQFFRIDPDQVRLETGFEDIRLDINSAMPCGLLANELVSNALKHAFPGGRKGVVRIGLRRRPEGRVEMGIEDDGVGLPPGLDFRGAKSFGFQIVALLVSQLEADIALDARHGTAFTIAFRELEYKKRI